MGNKLFFTGLFIFLALATTFLGEANAQLAGALIMFLGLILMWMDR